MALRINRLNADQYYQYLSPMKEKIPAKGFDKLGEQAKVFLHKLGYMVKNKSTINAKKIVSAIDENPAIKTDPKVARLYNEALKRINTTQKPINLLEMAKEHAMRGGISDTIENYGLSPRELYDIAAVLAKSNPAELALNYPKYQITEEVMKRLVQEASKETAQMLVAEAGAAVDFPAVAAVVASKVEDFSQALDRVMRGEPIHDIPLTDADRKALQIIQDRAKTVHHPDFQGDPLFGGTYLVRIARAAALELDSIVTGTWADKEAKQELIRYAMAKQEVDQTPKERLFTVLATSSFDWELTQEHGYEILKRAAERSPEEFIDKFNNDFFFEDYKNSFRLQDLDRVRLIAVAQAKLNRT